jgi:hypothetical protein
MNRKLASLLALLVFALLALGGSVASAQAPDGASHDRVQQQRAPAACPPDVQWGCVLSGSLSPGLTLNSSATANNSYSLYASLNNPGSGSAAVWGRVLGSGSIGYGVYGSHQGSGYGVYGFSNNGIGFLGYSNTGTGMQGESYSTGNRPGILGQHRATTGTGAGVEGRTSSTSDAAAGVLGIVTSSNGGYDSAGVMGINKGTWSVSYGVMGSSASEEGSGVYGVSPYQGVFGQSTGTNGVGVHGWAGAGTGVYGESTSGTAVYGTNGVGNKGGLATDSAGVYGESSGYSWGVRGKSTNYPGVYGTSDSNAGVSGASSYIGVRGESGSGYGVSGSSTSSYGVFGHSSNSYGVYGTSAHGDGVVGRVGVEGNAIAGYSDAGANSPGNAGYFYGNVEVIGTLRQSGGALRMDHPLDPENQYLSHSFVESPDMKNVYDGNVTLDANGVAVVELPAYFQVLNRDFRYQLTAIGAPGPNLYIAEQIQNNRFKIAGGTPGMLVSWQVTGIRQDPWANENRIPVEEPKPADERGTYLYPEGYGQPESRGVDYEERQHMREMQDTAPAPAEAPGR